MKGTLSVLALSLLAVAALSGSARAQVNGTLDATYKRFELGGSGKVTLDGKELNIGVGKLGFDVANGGKFTSVCGDLLSTLDGNSHSYALSLTPDDFSPLGRAGKIVGSYFTAATTNEQAQGLQLAVWKALYDNGASFSTGSRFTASADFGSVGTAGSALNFAKTYYDGAQSGRAVFAATGAGGGQSQLTPVPEPASLCALAIGGAALLRRRKAKRG